VHRSHCPRTDRSVLATGDRLRRLAAPSLAFAGIVSLLACNDGGDEPTVAIAAPGWALGVVADGLGGVDNLAVGAADTIYATNEEANRVFEIVAGASRVLATGIRHARTVSSSSATR
jgi:hypothetical protein